MFRLARLLMIGSLVGVLLLLASGVLHLAQTDPDGTVALRPRVDVAAAKFYARRALTAVGPLVDAGR